MSDKDDDPYSGLNSSIDQSRQRDDNLFPNDFLYKDIVMFDDNIAVIGGEMTDEEIVHNIIENVEEEFQEEDKDTLIKY